MTPEQLHQAFEDAFNSHDVDAIVALYEPDAVMVNANGALYGIDAIRELYRRALATRPRIELHTLGVHRAGDLAMLHGKWTVREIAPDGAAIRREGRNTEVARLQPDGRWLFVIDQPSVPQD
jgi:uncharacterized protein (TIGR02246 family)